MTAAMCKRLIIVSLLAGAILATCGGAAQAQTPIRHSIYRQYIDPFATPGWVPNRTDMGVDWLVTRPLPVIAIGDAVILGSNSNDAGGTGTEWGWADADGATRAGWVGPSYKEGEQTASGNDMARFMKSLGATVHDPPGRGPNAPFGKFC